MNKTLLLISSAVLVTTFVQTARADEAPQPVHAGTRILRSGGLVVEVGDPDSADCRWNKGLRFSPVAKSKLVTCLSLLDTTQIWPWATNMPFDIFPFAFLVQRTLPVSTDRT